MPSVPAHVWSHIFHFNLTRYYCWVHPTLGQNATHYGIFWLFGPLTYLHQDTEGQYRLFFFILLLFKYSVSIFTPSHTSAPLICTSHPRAYPLWVFPCVHVALPLLSPIIPLLPPLWLLSVFSHDIYSLLQMAWPLSRVLGVYVAIFLLENPLHCIFSHNVKYLPNYRVYWIIWSKREGCLHWNVDLM